MIFFQHYFHSDQHFFLLEQTVLNVLQTFKTDWVKSSTQYILVIQNSSYIDYPLFCHPSCTSVLYQFSIITIIYFIIDVKWCSPNILVEMSTNCRTPSHQSILCIFHFSQFLTKCILLAMCLVCLVSLPFLSIHIKDLLYNTIKRSSSGTMYRSLFC